MFKPAKAMFRSMQCRLKGHVYVDSRSQPGTRVCVRCQDRRPFEGLRETSGDADQSAHPRAAVPARPCTQTRRLCTTAASMNPANRGCGANGRLLSSG